MTGTNEEEVIGLMNTQTPWLTRRHRVLERRRKELAAEQAAIREELDRRANDDFYHFTVDELQDFLDHCSEEIEQ